MLLIPLVLFALAGAGQSVTAEVQSLRGIVRDQTGAVLQGAMVELSPFFGQAIAAMPPRRLQLSLGFHF